MNYGLGTNLIWGNRGYGYATNGAVNGLSLGTYAPTCREEENTYITNEGLPCPNVNVSQFPQLITRSWRTESSSLFPVADLPDQELPGFYSIHRITRGNYALPFVADANSINNSATVLQLASANQVNPDIGVIDLARWLSPNWRTVEQIGNTYLHIKIRMRLDAAGTVTVTVNPSASSDWNPVNIQVNSQSWTWYTFECSVADLTLTDHTMNAFLWSIDVGTPKLLVDGFVFATI